MASFGENLRRERKARNIRVREIAESTKISSIYLRALEANDFGQLPGTVFNKGYVRAYAEFIGVDPDATVAAYEEEEKAQAEEARLHPKGPVVVVSRTAAAGRSRARTYTLAAVGAIALGAAGIFLMMDRGEEDPSTAAPRESFASRKEAPGEDPLKASAALLESHPEESAADERPAGEAREPAPPEPSRPAPDPVRPPAPPATPAEPPPTKAPAPADDGTGTQPAGGSSLRVPESGVGSAVVDLELVDRRERFSPGEKAHFWARVMGGRPGAVVRHVWIREEQPVSEIVIDLGGPHWRTYSWQTMRADCGGTWVVEARDEANTVLARESFVCRP